MIQSPSSGYTPPAKLGTATQFSMSQEMFKSFAFETCNHEPMEASVKGMRPQVRAR